MVGHDSRSARLSHFQIVLAGGTSSFVTRALCQPFDVLKIRFQLQVEPVKLTSVSKYVSIRQAFSLIVSEEGIGALWKGHVPAQILSVTYGMVQFWVFEALSKEAHLVGFNDKYSPVVNFSCGSLAGCLATISSFPFDVVRTRLVGQSEHHKVYSNVFCAIIKIWQSEGFLMLFRGLFPTLLQTAPHTGVQFACYKLFDDIYKALMEQNDSSISSSVFAGSLAGLCAKTSIYPFDLMKKRMQIQGIQKYRTEFGKLIICNGMLDCLKKTIQGEGFSGLFKGLSPSLLKAVVTSAVHFVTYDMACKFLEDLNS